MATSLINDDNDGLPDDNGGKDNDNKETSNVQNLAHPLQT